MVRVNIQQAALPLYRVPFFRKLGQVPDLQVRLFHGSMRSLPQADAKGFASEHVKLHSWKLLGQPLMWHGPQIRLADRAHSDVLILSWDLHYASLVPALLRARLNKVPTILWGHGYSKTENWARRRARETVGKLATALAFYERSTAESYIKAGHDPLSVFVAQNALDQEPILAAQGSWRPDDLAEFRRRNGLSDGPVFLFSSRLDAANQLDVLLRSASMLRQRHANLRVVIIGGGEPEMSRLRHLANELALEANLIFAGAIYDEAALAPWFLSATAYCYPSNAGLSILHAMGYGVPLVVGDRRASHGPEIDAVVPGQNGVSFPHGDPEALAEALDLLASDGALRARLGEGARRTVADEFTMDLMVAGMVDAIHYCAARIPRARSAY